MTRLIEYFDVPLSRLDVSGNKETRRYSLPIELNFEQHYLCFLKTLLEDRIFLQNEHLEDIASRYASAVADTMQSLAPLTPKT